MSDQDWVSLHIFYHGDLDALLLQGVEPLVHALLKEDRIRSWFFVRYWNGGPHVRLRLQAGRPGGEQGVTPEAVRRLERFLAERPGGEGSAEAYQGQAAYMDQLRARLQTNWEGIGQHLDEAEPFQPGNLVQVQLYVFDRERYGGVHARAVTEQHFYRSSELALSVLRRMGGSAGARYALALRMMAAASEVLGLSAREGAALFDRYFGVAEHLDPVGAPRFLERWGFIPFEQQREEVCAALAGDGEESLSPFARAVLRMWKADLSESFGFLRQCHEQGKLSGAPAVTLLDYLHLLNNRMGISVHVELYLVYLLARGLETIAHG